MNTKQWTPVLIVSLLAFGSVQAFADSDGYYDENIDSSTFSFVGSSVAHSTSRSEDESVGHSASTYYDEDGDTIAFNDKGNRSNHTQANSSIEAPLVDFEMAYLDQ